MCSPVDLRFVIQKKSIDIWLIYDFPQKSDFRHPLNALFVLA